jgi:signal transduction histidine kinase
VAICLPNDQGWRVYQGASEDLTIDGQTLDMRSPSARRRGVRCAAAGVWRACARRTESGHLDRAVETWHEGHRVARGLLIHDRYRRVSTRWQELWPSQSRGHSFLAERDAAELVRQKADLAAALLASLSHDLRTPLTAIRVAVENLREELTPDERREQSRAAISELSRLTRLVQDILDMAEDRRLPRSVSIETG